MVAARGACGPRRAYRVAPVRAPRPAFASLRRTAEFGALAPPDRGAPAAARPRWPHPALAHLEANAVRRRAAEPGLEWRARSVLRGRGVRGALELVGEELLELLRSRTAPEQIALVAASLERWRAPFETDSAPWASPTRSRRGCPSGDAVRHALLSAAPLRLAGRRQARLSSSRNLRSPYSGVPPTTSTSWRAACVAARSPPSNGSRRRSRSSAPERSSQCTGCAMRSRRSRPCGDLATAMLRAAHGLESPRSERRPGSTCARTRRASACSTSWPAGSA